MITLRQPAQRLLSLYGAYNEILVALGLEDRIIARTKADGYLPALRDKPSIGTHMRPNVEMILGLQPDLVIQDAGRQEALPGLEQLQQRQIPVAVFHPTTFEHLFSVIERLGCLTDTQEAAAALIASLKERLAKVALRVQKAEARPRVFFEIRYPNLLAAGEGSIVADIIRRAGGINCVTSPKRLVRLNLEAVIAAAPEVYLMQRGPMNPNPMPLKQRPGFGILSPAQTGRVLVVDERLYSRPGPQAVTAVEELARFLHPRLFSQGEL